MIIIDTMQAFTALRASLRDAARAAGAVTITAEYEGGSDNGAFSTPDVEPADAHAVLQSATVMADVRAYDTDARAYTRQSQPVAFLAAVKEILAHALELEHGNWWNGCIETRGSVVWHVADDPDRITGEHEHIRREAEYTEWEHPADDHHDAVAGGA